MNLRKKSTREEFERALAQCKREDFDGHTEFHRLTPEQRLEWLFRPRRSCTNSKGKRILTLGTNHASRNERDTGYQFSVVRGRRSIISYR